MTMHTVTVTVRSGKSEKQIKGSVNARNGKGALRVFLLKSESLTEFGGDIVRVEIEADETALVRGFVGEEIVKAPRKPKAEKAADEPAAE